MRLSQVITDYVPRSILTTQGDLIARGVALPERLAAGALNTVLKGQGAGVIPAFELPSIADMQLDQVSFLDVAAGNLTTAALSFAPKLLYIIARDDVVGNLNYSQGFSTSSIYHISRVRDGGTAQAYSIVDCLFVRRNAANLVRGVVSDWAANGFSITMTWTGVITVDVIVLCFG